jgi:hypothetical protein
MFIGLIAPFEEGQCVPVSLNFERAGKIEASFEVGSVGAKGPRRKIASIVDAGPRRGQLAAESLSNPEAEMEWRRPQLYGLRHGPHSPAMT